MRICLALALLGFLGACAAQPSTGKQSSLSSDIGPSDISPQSARVQADVQHILRGMEQARTSQERVARYGR